MTGIAAGWTGGYMAIAIWALSIYRLNLVTTLVAILQAMRVDDARFRVLHVA